LVRTRPKSATIADMPPRRGSGVGDAGGGRPGPGPCGPADRWQESGRATHGRRARAVPGDVGVTEWGAVPAGRCGLRPRRGRVGNSDGGCAARTRRGGEGDHGGLFVGSGEVGGVPAAPGGARHDSAHPFGSLAIRRGGPMALRPRLTTGLPLSRMKRLLAVLSIRVVRGYGGCARTSRFVRAGAGERPALSVGVVPGMAISVGPVLLGGTTCSSPPGAGQTE
jgi:hypothetical protein